MRKCPECLDWYEPANGTRWRCADCRKRALGLVRLHREGDPRQTEDEEAGAREAIMRARVCRVPRR